MPSLQLLVNGRTYEVACDAGQEQHVRDLARDLDERIRKLVQQVGPGSEGRLLVMAGLLLSDELFEARDQVRKAGEAQAARAEASARENAEEPARRAAEEHRLAETLDGIAKRLEAIAAQLEAA
jgi:cell division protein ZapA